MDTYTFIMGFNGGTYISQIEAVNLDTALPVWAEHLNVEEIEDLDEQGKQEVIENIKEETPTLIDGAKNVWFSFIRTSSGDMYINIVKTVK